MKIALIADTFPPLRTSGAVQLSDLSREFVRKGHAITVLLPAVDQQQAWHIEEMEGVSVVYLRARRTKDIGYVQRTLNELLMPFMMLHNLRKTLLAAERWDGIILYSPSIFLGPLANSLKKASGCKVYLIVRDIFPEWAVDMELMSRGLPYLLFDAVARYQYSVADIIGIQAPGNRKYFIRWLKKSGRILEVLQNWLSRHEPVLCPIRVNKTPLEGRRIFVYAGNMGIAQGMDILLDLAENLMPRIDVGFLFIGRGSEAARLKKIARARNLTNVLFYDEIYPGEILSLYEQCSIGLIALDPRHKSHNIPGKFLSYMQNGLPVLANVNQDTELAKLIRKEKVGQVCESGQLDELLEMAEVLLSQIDDDFGMSARCCKLFDREFSTEHAVRQIVAALSA